MQRKVTKFLLSPHPKGMTVYYNVLATPMLVINANLSILSSRCVDLALFQRDNHQRGGRGDALTGGNHDNQPLRGPWRPLRSHAGWLKPVVSEPYLRVRCGLTGFLRRPGSDAMNPSYPLTAPEGVEAGMLLSPAGESRSKPAANGNLLCVSSQAFEQHSPGQCILWSLMFLLCLFTLKYFLFFKASSW